MQTTDVAGQFILTVPRSMRILRSLMRKSAVPGLSVPQFRILAQIQGGIDCASEIAELHGVSLPAMSKMINLLAKKGLIKRTPRASDRRYSRLSLTGRGAKVFASIRSQTQRELSGIIKEHLSTTEIKNLVAGLKVLHKFSDAANQERNEQ